MSAARHTRAPAAIIQKTRVPKTMGAGVSMGVRTATEVLMKTGLNTTGIPITGMTNTRISKSETKDQRRNDFGLAIVASPKVCTMASEWLKPNRRDSLPR